MTNLTVSALLNQIAEIQKLLNEGRPVNETDEWGDSALHAAALKGRLTVAKLLIDKGADVNQKNHAGSTPLHKAVVGGNASLIELLMHNGADGDARNNAGLLPEDYTKKKSLKLMVLGKSAVEIKHPVPRNMRGLVIGQGGKTLKRIRATSGADLAFPTDENEEEVVIRGRAEAVDKAKELVDEILNKRKEVEAAREAKEREFYSGDYTRINVHVPKQQHKLIIGAGGKNIREIIKETGVKIRIPPEHEEDEDIVIEGPVEAVDRAAERITKASRLQEQRGDNGNAGGGKGRSGGNVGSRSKRDGGDEFAFDPAIERRFEGGRGRGRGRDEDRGSNITLAHFLPNRAGPTRRKRPEQ